MMEAVPPADLHSLPQTLASSSLIKGIIDTIMYTHLDPLIDKIDTPEWQAKADTCWVDDLKQLSWNELCHVVTRGYADGHSFDLVKKEGYELEALYDYCLKPNPWLIRQAAKRIRTQRNLASVHASADAKSIERVHDPRFEKVVDAVVSRPDVVLKLGHGRFGDRGRDVDVMKLLESLPGGWVNRIEVCYFDSKPDLKGLLLGEVNLAGLEYLQLCAEPGESALNALAPHLGRRQEAKHNGYYSMTRLDLGPTPPSTAVIQPCTDETLCRPRVVSLRLICFSGELTAHFLEMMGHPDCRLVSLKLWYITASRDEHNAMWNAIGRCTSLRVLEDDRGDLPSCWPALIASTSLEDVTLWNAVLGDDTVAWLTAVAQRPGFRKIHIARSKCNNLQLLPALGIALSALCAHPCLELLHICNTYGVEGVITLGSAPVKFDALSTNTAMKELWLRCIHLTTVQWTSLVDACVRNTVLKRLDVSVECFEEAFYRSLTMLFSTNTTLRRIRLNSGVQVAPETKLPWQKDLLRELERNSLLTEFHLVDDYSPELNPSFAALLDANYTLSSFGFDCLNDTGYNGVYFGEVNCHFNRKRVYGSGRVTDWLEGMSKLSRMSDRFDPVYYLVRSRPEWIGRLASAGQKSRKRRAGETT